MKSAASKEQFMVVAFTDHQRERRSFLAWPQHVTILPWMEGYRFQASNRIADAVAAFPAIDIEIDGEADFAGGHVPVWTIAENEVLRAVHEAVLAAGPKNGTSLVVPSHTGEAYAPHITKKADQPERYVGERLTLQELSIIGHHATGNTIFRNIVLGGDDEATA